MLERLNQNQGIIATIAIFVTIVGFFITNKHITNKMSQKQKGGDNSTNTQIGNISNNKQNE